MAPPDRSPAGAPAEAEPAAVVRRRAPFSDNPNVGARGQRTQQRILDAALRVFGEAGYHQCTIDNIAKAAGCSRVSFYQYFAGKEDVFRHLATQVARQLGASTDWLDPITADATGWSALRAWVERYAEIYDRYQPVFQAFSAAAESDSQLAGDSVRTANRYVAGVRSRVAAATLPPRELDAVIELLLESLPRLLDDLSMLQTAAVDAYPTAAVLDLYTDVVHRSLFGLDRAVNVHTTTTPPPPNLPFGPVISAALDRDGEPTAQEPAGSSARTALLAAGRDVFVSRGYFGTRIDDIAEAAGVSHGTFYFYFDNKDQLALLLAAQAMRSLATSLARIPTIGGDVAADRAALRRWLRAYGRTQIEEAAMIRVWVDAALQDDSLTADSASVLEWGRRRMAQFLRPRAFGDTETEGIVLVAFVDALATRPLGAPRLDAAVTAIERGFLGR